MLVEQGKLVRGEGSALLQEGLDLSPYAVRMALCGLDQDIIDLVTSEEVFNRPATIYSGLLDENGVLVDTPTERWSGAMDSLSLVMGGAEEGAALQCESDFRFFDQASGALFTDEHQQRRHPGDLFFEFLPQMQDAKVFWGPNGTPLQLGGRVIGEQWWSGYY